LDIFPIKFYYIIEIYASNLSLHIGKNNYLPY